nr:hypothetical protein B0A51_03791 [Rachicladosporium sp. CCFEE 5018]
MFEPLSAVAAVFGGISAVNAVTDLWKKWKARRQRKKDAELSRVDGAFEEVPRFLRNAVDCCAARAGQAFRVPDGKSLIGLIGRTVTIFQRTLGGTLHIALNGGNLDLARVHCLLSGFGRDMTSSLGDVFTRVCRSMPNTYSRNRSVSEAATSSLELRVIPYDFNTALAALPPLQFTGVPIATTLERMKKDWVAEDLHSTLAADLDAIVAARVVIEPCPRIPIMELESWNVLRVVIAEAGL